MPGDDRNEFFCGEDGKILFVFAVGHFGAIDHHAGLVVNTALYHKRKKRKGLPYKVSIHCLFVAVEAGQ